MSKGLEQVLLNRDNPRDSRDRKKFKTSAAEADSAVFVQEDGIDVNLAMPHELAMLRRDPDRVQFHDTCWGDDEYINFYLLYDDTYAERKLLHITKAGIPTSYITNYPGADVPLVPGPRLRKLERRPVGGADTSSPPALPP